MYGADKVREFNDAARQTLTGCRIVITRGVAALDCTDDVLAEVRSFSDFTAGNDPFSEHDFGSVQVAGQTLFWKFDYFDLTMTMLSPDPADPSVTVRVLTIMLSNEY